MPVGRGLAREAFGLVTTLPWSGAHAAVFSLGRTVGDLRPSLLGCTTRLGGVPRAFVFDDDASVVASREGGRPRLHPEISALLGALRARAIVLRPAAGPSSGDTSPRSSEPVPDTDLHLEARAVKGWVRVLTADYSVPPAYVDGRIAIRVTPTHVHLACEGAGIAVHARSFVPADVVLAPAHGRAVRLAREARDRLTDGDVELPPVDLARYDALWESPA